MIETPPDNEQFGVPADAQGRVAFPRHHGATPRDV